MTIQVFIESPVSLPLWVGITLLNGVFLYRLSRPFAAVKEGLGWKALLLVAFSLASGMVIWVGDNNLLFTLPAVLPVADPDLCALLGNALDNAIEAACKADDKRILVRCRADKGMLMLRVENALTGEETPGLATTKADKSHHGFGLAGMREIAARYGGTLETRAADGRFELVVCLPL